MLEAPAGQRINISLLDFTAAARLTSQHLTRSTSHIITSSSSSSSSSGSCVDEKHQYGYIIDKSSVNKKNVSVCHARSDRQTHVYLSTSNTLQLILTTKENVLLKVQGFCFYDCRNALFSSTVSLYRLSVSCCIVVACNYISVSASIIVYDIGYCCIILLNVLFNFKYYEYWSFKAKPT